MATAVAEIPSVSVTVPRYTVDQLDAFPRDGNRYELLGGVLLVSPQARPVHQIVATRLAVPLSAAVGRKAWVVGPGSIFHGSATSSATYISIWVSPRCGLST